MNSAPPQRLRWTARARADLVSIARFIAAHNPDAARATIDRLRARARQACAFPGSGRIVPEFGRREIREFICGNYRIVFRVLPGEVHVLTVFEGHRRLPPGEPAGE